MSDWLQSLLSAAQLMSPWEFAAVIFAIIYLLLAVRENVLCWLFAFISTAIFTILFWDVSLLMESALNVYYMAMAVYGWHQWTRGGTNGKEQPHALEIQSMTGQQHVLVITAIAVLSFVSGYLLSEHSDAAWPYVDSSPPGPASSPPTWSPASTCKTGSIGLSSIRYRYLSISIAD